MINCVVFGNGRMTKGIINENILSKDVKIVGYIDNNPGDKKGLYYQKK